jgi:hypothetical protein
MQKTRSKLRFVVLAMMLAAAARTSPLYSLPEEVVQAKARTAFSAEEEGRHEDAYQLWVELISMGRAGLGERLYALVRSHIYHEAVMLAAKHEDDCSIALEWVKKGKQPGPPSYSNAYDVYYSALTIAEGICHSKAGKYEEAYELMTLAKNELGKAPSGDAEWLIDQVDEYLSSFKPRVISEGKYITNKGAIQAWIGKVVSRSGGSVQVMITYVNRDMAAGLVKGKVENFPVSQCKEVTAVSADAIVKGWKE